MERFDFSMPLPYAAVVLAWGVTPGRAWVEVDDDRVRARFGFFHVETTRDNVVGATRESGPFNPLTAIGVRFSFSDASITFGSDVRDLVEIRFRRAVTLRPPGRTRHRALWVSVAEPDRLVEVLS